MFVHKVVLVAVHKSVAAVDSTVVVVAEAVAVSAFEAAAETVFGRNDAPDVIRMKLNYDLLALLQEEMEYHLYHQICTNILPKQ